MTERGNDGVDGPVGGSADIRAHTKLMEQTRQAARILAHCGVGRGSKVAVMLPMCPESVLMSLACLRLDALRVTLPPGEYSAWIRERLRSSGVGVVVTADSCFQNGRVVPAKAVLDRALAGCPDVGTVLVVPQLPRPVPWTPGRDRWWSDFFPPGASARKYPGVMTERTRSSAAQPAPSPGSPSGIVFDDPLFGPAEDDLDRGWGERLSGEEAPADDLDRFLHEKPPHHS